MYTNRVNYSGTVSNPKGLHYVVMIVRLTNTQRPRACKEQTDGCDNENLPMRCSKGFETLPESHEQIRGKFNESSTVVKYPRGSLSHSLVFLATLMANERNKLEVGIC